MVANEGNAADVAIWSYGREVDSDDPTGLVDDAFEADQAGPALGGDAGGSLRFFAA